MDELRANPFAPRICELFSEDGSGSLTFTNFLDMKSAFSKKASPEVRLVWAFALWDFDGDDLIGIPDVKCGVDLITNSTTYINETALPLKEDDLLEMLDPYELEEVSRPCHAKRQPRQKQIIVIRVCARVCIHMSAYS